MRPTLIVGAPLPTHILEAVLAHPNFDQLLRSVTSETSICGPKKVASILNTKHFGNLLMLSFFFKFPNSTASSFLKKPKYFGQKG